MTGLLNFRFFAHSWISDWNHGNAHFLRGLASQLVRRGHQVRCYEERNGWSMANLAREGAAPEALIEFRNAFPELDVRFYTVNEALKQLLREELSGADVVVVHEWNSPEVVTTILALKSELGFRALFHDTHHRAYSSPREILRFPLGEFDGVLAFGEALRRIYRDALGAKRTWTFHEGADTTHFFPRAAPAKDTDVVWIGNWGDEERARELEEFLIRPATAMQPAKFAVYGVRYPEPARARLAESGIEFRGYLPNLRAPQVYVHSKISLHVPRKFYANGLSGVPTIRVFEALAAGVPLVSSPWNDSEGLFRPGEDYVSVPDCSAMLSELRNLLADDAAREQLSKSGVKTIRSRHTCAHRAEQLLDICHELGSGS
ncbi:MAG: glycosyltransferase [Acidobacteria bacterium]|nr:glycosyltransferase [Acidobacteriota bacterium]